MIRACCFFDSKTKKYILMQGDVFCPLDTNYIRFTIGNHKFNPVVDFRYFIKLYYSLLKKKTEKEPNFALEDTEENLKKVKKLIHQKSETFAICDYKENKYYIKCLSGEDDELMFHLQF